MTKEQRLHLPTMMLIVPAVADLEQSTWYEEPFFIAIFSSCAQVDCIKVDVIAAQSHNRSI
jgi:hypothetical protein